MSDRIAEIEALLIEAERAHGAYEAEELGGVYDTEWPRWYATYLAEHGLGRIVGGDPATDEIAGLLATGFEDFQRADPPPDEPWSSFLARRLAGALTG